MNTEAHTSQATSGELPATPKSTPPLSFLEATRLWARIGLLSFGGPAAQIALMHRELVETRRWLSDGRFLHALNYCMLLPGPEAQQLAVYIGWLMHRTAGGIVAGVLFVLPGFATILALSILYAEYGQLPLVSALFYGIKAAVLAVVVEAVVRLGRRVLRNKWMIALAVLSFVAIHFLALPFPIAIAGAAVFALVATFVAPGLIPEQPRKAGSTAGDYLVDRLLADGGLRHTTPATARTVRIAATWLAAWLVPLLAAAAALGPDHILVELGTFFSKAAVVTFGGAYSVLAYVAQQGVEVYGWLRPGEMIDGLALAETTPGPLIMVVQFVGYLAAARAEFASSPILGGLIGSIVVVWVTFVPSFLWVFAGAPYVESLQGNRRLHAILTCVTASVVGAVLNLSVWFSMHVVFGEVGSATFGPLHLMIPNIRTVDGASLLIAVTCMVAILRYHVGIGRTLAMASLAGFAWRMASG